MTANPYSFEAVLRNAGLAPQYTYLNVFIGNFKNAHNKFENDYWASSIHELIRHSKFEKGNIIKFGTCGANPEHIKNYFLQKGFNNFIFVVDNSPGLISKFPSKSIVADPDKIFRSKS